MAFVREEQDWVCAQGKEMESYSIDKENHKEVREIGKQKLFKRTSGC